MKGLNQNKTESVLSYKALQKICKSKKVIPGLSQKKFKFSYFGTILDSVTT